MWCWKTSPLWRNFILWYIAAAIVLTFGGFIGYKAYALNWSWAVLLGAVLPFEVVVVGVATFAATRHFVAIDALKVAMRRELDV